MPCLAGVFVKFYILGDWLYNPNPFVSFGVLPYSMLTEIMNNFVSFGTLSPSPPPPPSDNSTMDWGQTHRKRLESWDNGVAPNQREVNRISGGVAGLCRDTNRLWRVQSTAHPLCHGFTVIPPSPTRYFMPPFKLFSPKYSKPHSDNYGNYLRRLAFALASIFLYGCVTNPQPEDWNTRKCCFYLKLGRMTFL